MGARGGLLNYTTEVAAEKSIGEIVALLVRGGAQEVSHRFRDGRVSAIAFKMPDAFGEGYFVLPANVDGVLETLKRHAKARKVPPRFASYDQAARVGWRIVKDWLEAQLALIESGQAQLDQVMLPYLQIKGGKSVYQAMREHHASLPAPSADAVDVEFRPG